MLVGVKDDFTAHWNCTRQEYVVRKGGKYLLTCYGWSVLKNYVDRV